MKNYTKILGSLALIVLVILGVYFYQKNSNPTNEQIVKIGYLPLTDHLPLMVAEGEKLFHNVKVEPVKFTDWPSLVEALKAKQIDGAHIINTLAVKAISGGYDGKIVALSHRGDIALVTKQDITDVQQLKGKTIAVPSRFSPHFMMLHNYLTQNGFDVEKDVKILDIAPPDFVSTMVAGRIDGFIGSEPFPTLAVGKNVGKKFKLWNEMQIAGTNGLDCVVVFRGDLVANNPALIQNYVNTIIKAGMAIENAPYEAASAASPFLLNLTPNVIVKAIDEPRDLSSYDNLTPRLSEFEAFQNYMIQIGLIKEGINLNNVVDDHFAKNAYAELK